LKKYYRSSSQKAKVIRQDMFNWLQFGFISGACYGDVKTVGTNTIVV
jgi:hypothetical protein